MELDRGMFDHLASRERIFWKVWVAGKLAAQAIGQKKYCNSQPNVISLPRNLSITLMARTEGFCEFTFLM